MSNGSTPPGFPSGIPVQQETFENWSQGIMVPNLWTCTPQTETDVVSVCNWAAGAGYTVRARGIMHTWSPLTVTQGESPANVLLVDTTVNLNNVISVTPAAGGQPAQVTVQTGATMLALLTAMQNASGGQGAASGFSFAHVPAPGNLTVGGVLAIDAHGTAVPTPPNDAFSTSYGSLSNLILSFKAVVTDPSSPTPNQYTTLTFERGQGDAKAFLTHLGRAFLLEVTLQAVDNYNLRCQSFVDITASTMFQPPPTPTGTPPANSVGAFLNQSGRVEVIWFPPLPLWPGLPVPTTYPWLKVWTVEAQQPQGSVAVTGPYNYPFSDNLSEELSNLLKQILSGLAWLTPTLTSGMAGYTKASLTNDNLTDLWGPSMYTLLYVKDTTLRVTANGYAVLMHKNQVQQAIADFTTEFVNLLLQFQKHKPKPLYPINSPCEIRVTALDDPSTIAAPSAQSPVISALSVDPVVIENGWDVAVWFDILTTMPPLQGGTQPDPQQANDFYTQLEQWMATRFGAGYRANPEWSKGWAYTASGGPWTDSTYIESIRETFTTGRAADDTWAWEVATLAKYDAGNLFFNPFLTSLFTT